jgi:hypothetical protein
MGRRETHVSPDSTNALGRAEAKPTCLVAILAAPFVFATYVEMPVISVFTGQQYITLQ